MITRFPRRFHLLLEILLARSEDNTSEWAARLKLSQGQLSNLLAGRRRPPENTLERWLDIMEQYGIAISDAEKTEFQLSGLLAQSPVSIEIHLQKLHNHIDELTAKVDLLTRKVAEHRVEYDVKKPPTQQ